MNGQTQIEIGGKVRSLYFGMDANEIFFGLIAKAPVQTTALSMRSLVYAGLINQCLITNESPDFTLQDVAVWVDDMLLDDKGREVLKQVDGVYADSRAYKALVEEGQKKSQLTTA